MAPSATPEEHKELGNKAFSTQDFEGSITHYSKAIQLDPQNHVFFSNRSASYAGINNWTKAMEDAKECIRLNPQFMKGYYRLATAQIELEHYDHAMSTIKQGLTLDSNNAQLLKVMRSIKQAKRVANSSLPVSNQDLDPSNSKELYDLQIQHSIVAREYNTVQANLNKLQRENKMNQITLAELEQNPSNAAHFKSTGKIFVKHQRESIFDHLKSSMKGQEKAESDMSQKLEYLERKLHSQQQNIKEVTSGGQ